MPKIYPKTYFDKEIRDLSDAKLSIASSAVLYGLSVYTVFPVVLSGKELKVFALLDHYQRLLSSTKIIGINTFAPEWTFDKFLEVVKKVIGANDIKETVFVRATIHVDELLPGTKAKDLKTNLSIFAYEALPIVPQNGMSLKTSVWRRTPDFCIPSRAKVNGAYINSVLAKQEAIDSGYDDCIFLDNNGHVCELSAANIFIVRGNIVITPDKSTDLLEGINRKLVIEITKKLNLELETRTIDLTELYIADEVFACGTSSMLAPVTNIDGREIGKGTLGRITKTIRDEYLLILNDKNKSYEDKFTSLKNLD